MKITNAEVIKSGEKDLIDSITADLDWSAIEDIFLTEHNLRIDEDIEYKNGDIIAHNNQVAYKLEFTVKVNLSVLINREGEYLSVKISGKGDGSEQEGSPENMGTPSGDKANGEVTEQDEGTAAAETSPSGEVIEAQYTGDTRDREDKYIEALEQLSSDDPGEAPSDTILQENI